jgi:hypothetical protein
MEKKENERTQAPPKLREEKRKALLLSGAHTAVTGANEKQETSQSPFSSSKKPFPIKSLLRNPDFEPARSLVARHMMP